MSTSLYRHFSDDGTLLYVGISLSWPTRTKAHARSSLWFHDVAKVEIERFDTREAALEAEREAIKREGPRFNVVHNRGARPAHVVKGGTRRRSVQIKSLDPIISLIKGPDAIVGPALIYREDLISVMVAHGQPGSEGELSEIVLGEHFPDVPDIWHEVCASVITIRCLDQITWDEAKEARADMVRRLRCHLRSVEVYETDLALAVAYASRFPSEKSRKVLDDVALERGVAA